MNKEKELLKTIFQKYKAVRKKRPRERTVSCVIYNTIQYNSLVNIANKKGTKISHVVEQIIKKTLDGTIDIEIMKQKLIKHKKHYKKYKTVKHWYFNYYLWQEFQLYAKQNGILPSKLLALIFHDVWLIAIDNDFDVHNKKPKPFIPFAVD